MPSELHRIICGWDGRSVAELESLYKKHSDSKGIRGELVRLVGRPDCQNAASWLIKRYCESGRGFTDKQVASIYDSLQDLEGWVPKLHILQSVEYLSVPDSHFEQVLGFVRTSLGDRNKMVRAWAYNGFAIIARRTPEYRDEAMEILNYALENESAAVQARVRNILKVGL